MTNEQPGRSEGAPADGPLDVVVVGELNVDLLLRGDVTPAFGQAEKLVDDAVLTIGSSSAIFACGVARLGLRTAFVGLVGDDVFGHYLIDALGARGIDTSGIIVAPGRPTGLTVHLNRADGDRAMLTHLGTISDLTPEQVEAVFPARARHLHLGSYFLLDALRPGIPALFARARAQGLTVSLDTNFDPRGAWDGGVHAALAHVDCFLPNETEALALTGLPNWQQALDALAQRVPVVALKRGAQGAVWRSAAGQFAAGTLPVQVVDTTGAGDSFDAGLVYALLAGWDPARCVAFACACGSLSTRAAGGTAAQATHQEALRAIEN